jgi:biopolymer transport protein ExbD
MADLHFIPSMNRRKGSRASVSRLIPDMTSMVGLGFLLVTFFVMAGNFVKSSAMAITMPVKPKDGYMDNLCGGIRASAVTTLLLGKNHQVHYYHGLNDGYEKQPELCTTTFDQAGLRQVLLELQQSEPYAVVLIKPTADAKYKDMVDVLDEMAITNTRKYALVDIAPEDKNLLRLNAL